MATATSNFPEIDDVGVIGWLSNGGVVTVHQMFDYDRGVYFLISWHAQDGMPATSTETYHTLEETHAAMREEHLNGEWTSIDEINQDA